MSDSDPRTLTKDARPRRIAFSTLGCKLNQFETDSIASRFMQEGYQVVPFGLQADIQVINSCTVTNKADRKSRNTINRALNLQGKLEEISLEGLKSAGSSMVVVTGCFVDSHRQELEEDGRTFVVDNEHKNRIFELVDAHMKGEIVHPESFEGDRFEYGTSARIFHTRGMIKIQDGCDNFCSFCIIPFVRGRAISRPLDEILDSARSMIAEGYRELVLTGVNMSRYRDGDTDFSSVVAALLELEGDFRLRISSIEPDQLDERFLGLMSHEKMCPHLHLCLQSGSEKILLQMRRQYSYSQYQQIVENLRSADPLCNITTDIIVGFPGEDEDEFAASLQAVREIGFGHVHAFKYSVRQGTRAERMGGQVPEKVKSRRSEELRVLAEAEKRRYRQRLVGGTQRVLVEKVFRREGRLMARGLGQHYVPVEFPVSRTDETGLENCFVQVNILGLAQGDDPQLLGEINDLSFSGTHTGSQENAGA